MKKISLLKSSEFKKVLLKKFLDSLSSSLKYNYYLTKPFLGKTLTKQDIKDMN